MSGVSAEELRARIAHPALFAAADDLLEAELARRAEIEAGAAVWLTPEQAAARIPHMTVRKLTALRARRRGPNYAIPNVGRVLYLASDIDAYCGRMEDAA